jgi:NADH-quinone oxidoreductase subunit H
MEQLANLWNLIEWTDTTVQIIATIVKFLILAVALLQIPPVMVWAERRAPALMQRRRGPNRVGIDLGPVRLRLYGLLQSFADAVKLIFKEEVVPTGAHKAFYHIAPIFGVFPAFLIACAIPYGPDLNVFGFTVPLSIIAVDVGFLFIFAISSLAVYGVTLAGYASNNKYSLLGSLRASAQMISYEIPLGLSLIPIVLIHGTLDLNTIVEGQSSFLQWGIFTAPLSFVLFFICMFAETNRAPFDLAEAESELVAGFHTEFNSAKFAAFFLSEYVAMFVLSALCATVFFGGWQNPFISNTELATFIVGILNAPLGGILGAATITNVAALIGVAVLALKAGFFMWMYVWVRWTLPRFRYDQLMNLGWKFMLPLGLANVVVTSVVLAFMKF